MRGRNVAKHQPDDLRKTERFPVEASVAFSGVEYIREGEGIVYNLSRGGCAIRSKHNVQPGIYLSLRLHLPDAATPVIIDMAVARWTVSQRFGLEFMLMDEGEAARLSRFLTSLESRAKGLAS